MLKFEPSYSSASQPTTYFDFSGRAFDSSQAVGPCATPWTLDEDKAFKGNFDGVENCCDYDVCNFGRGHCTSTVKSSYGFKSYGGCGTMGPIQGTSGVATGTTMIYVSKEPSACADIVPRDSPPSPPPSNCMDTNPVGAADSRGEACDTYNTWAGTIYDYCSTGWFDDDDFEAANMCCGCGGEDPTASGTPPSLVELLNELRAGQALTALVLAVASIGAGLLACAVGYGLGSYA